MVAGVVQPVATLVDHGDGDNVLAPNEVWELTVVRPAADLSDPSQIGGLNPVVGCQASGARPTYENVARVTVSIANITAAADEDSSHFCNPPPPPPVVEIRIKKAVNGWDADSAPGPVIIEDTPLLWTYVITNTGTVALEQIVVKDDKIDPTTIQCPASTLAPGQSMTCETAKDRYKAVVGFQQNLGTVTAQSASGASASDGDFAHYLGISNTLVQDWGDAPDSRNYPTLKADNGPSHTIVPGLSIGSAIDEENDGQPDLQAAGDDLQFDDEDGIGANACFVLGKPLTLDIPVTNSLGKDAHLYGWIDFDGNGDFGATEQQNAVIVSNANTQMAALAFDLPPQQPTPATFMRLRLSTNLDAAKKPTGAADDGEVEDHELHFVTPTITSDATQIVKNINQEAVLNATVAVTCGSVNALSICVDITNDADPVVCQPLASDGLFTFFTYSYTRTITGTDRAVIWVDLDRDRALSDVEPQIAIPVIWQKLGIGVESRINGRRAPSPPGVVLDEGAPIAWTHTVSNSGSVELVNVAVTDDLDRAIGCPQNRLAPNASMDCTESGFAQVGQQHKTVVAKGSISASEIITNSDTSYYLAKPTPIPPTTPLDWGDAPDSTVDAKYPTLAVHNGPRHVISSDLFMGDVAGDAEDNGQPNDDATGDDIANIDDEDGVNGNACFVRGKSARLDVSAINQLGQVAQVYGWADFDKNGRFEKNDLAKVAVPVGGGQIFALDFMPLIPDMPFAFVRLRLSTDPLAALPTGLAKDGEVEDYCIPIVTPTIAVSPMTASVLPGEMVVITATVQTPDRCGSVERLSVCWDVNGGSPAACSNIGPTGIVTFTHNSTILAANGASARLDTIRAWVDIDLNHRPDAGDPTATSVVNIGPPPQYVISLAPTSAALPIDAQLVLTATVVNLQGAPAVGQEVTWTVAGVNGPLSSSAQTDGNGQAHFAYIGLNPGQDKVTAALLNDTALPAQAAVTWYSHALALEPATDKVAIGAQHVLTATVFALQGGATADQEVLFTVTGANGPLSATAPTDDRGQALYRYRGPHVGRDTVTATLTNGAAAPAVATVDWYSYTITLTTPERMRVVGADGIVNAKVVDNRGQTVPNQPLQFTVSGVNTIPISNTAPTDNGGQTVIRYPYNADQNSLRSDWITATIPVAGTNISFSQIYFTNLDTCFDGCSRR
ncbi:MAG: GEVED domain-containing protein [Caldilineaceae bacterium]